MPISEADIRLVRESLPKVRERLAPASDVFYDNLFAWRPSCGRCSGRTCRPRGCGS